MATERHYNNMIVITMTTILVLSISCWLGRETGVEAVTTANSNSDSSFTTRVRGISEDLETALDNVLTVQNVTFTPLPMNRTYNSTTAYYPRGMTHVYNITRIIIDFIMAKEPLPPGFLVYRDGMIRPSGDLMSEWFTLIKHYGGLLAIVIVGILFIGIMPFAALFFCCCRCCGRCGARSQPFDKKHDMCKKVFLSMLLIAITTLMLFGVISAFVTNTYMQTGTDELPNSVRTTIKDTRAYISFTQLQIETLLEVNFQELENNLIDILDTSGVIVSDKLKEYSNAVALSQLAGIVHDLPGVSKDLMKMKVVTGELRTNASLLNDGLRHVKKELLVELTECQQAGVRECKEFKNFNDIGKLDTTVDFSNLPDVSESLNNITELLNSRIVEEVQKGKKAFDDIQKQIQKAVDDSIPVVKDAISGAGEAIRANAKNLTNILTQASDAIGQHSKQPVDQVDLYLAQYSIYRWYGGLAISTLLLIIAMCASCGLLCGICGKRPDGYGDDCCNKGAGSKFLMLGVAIIFLFSSALMAVCLATMLIGVSSQKGVCEPLKQPNLPSSIELWSLLDQLLGLDQATGLNIELSNVITACHRNQSVYQVLNLEQKFNLNELESYLDKYEISKKIAILKDKITMDHGITILTHEAKGKLLKLSESGIGDIKFDRFTEILRDNITSISLNDLAQKLTDTANKIGDKQDLQSIKLSLQRNALYLETYQKTLVDPMVYSAEDLKETAIRLEIGLKFNHSSFNEAVNYLLREVEEAQEYLQTNGTKDVAEIAAEFARNLESRIKHYLRHVGYQLKHNVGQCGPISNAYNATIVATCDKIIQPFNGFWVSLGWCILLFIPTLYLSVKLASLYQKSDPYPGPLVEAAHKKKTKKYGRGPAYHQESYENQGGGYASDSAPNPRSTSSGDGPGSSRDTRYTDMAPKHWEDFPNGGPPQYHSPPTEYERPPPYYYPGPGPRP